MSIPKRIKMSLNQDEELSPIVSDESRDSDLIDELNDDCLLRIFLYLPLGDRLTTETVCKRWKRVSKLAWYDVKHLDLTRTRRYTTDFDKLPAIYRNNQSVATILLRCGRSLEQLKIGSPCHYTMLSFVAKHCQNLTRLEIDFYGSVTNDQEIRTMPKLKYFGTTSGTFSNNILKALPCAGLAEIHLSAFGAKAPPLTSMSCVYLQNLENVSVLSLRGFHLSNDMLEVICSKSNLKALTLSFCSGLFDQYLTFGSLSNLEHLELLGGRNNITDINIIQLPENCKKLKYLDLRWCDVTDEGIRNLWKLPQLEKLMLARTGEITDEHFKRLHNIRELNCEGCDMVHDEGVITVMRSAINLEYLNLERTSVSEEVLNVANEISKRRTNGVPLRVFVDRYLTNNWNGHDSPLLILGNEPNDLVEAVVREDDEVYDDQYEFEYDYGSDASNPDHSSGEEESDH